MTMAEVYAYQGGAGGRYRVSIQIPQEQLDGMVENAIGSAEADDMVFSDPARAGQHPYHVREYLVMVKVRTTDLFVAKGKNA